MFFRYYICALFSILLISSSIYAKPTHHKISHKTTHSHNSNEHLFRPRTSASLVADAETGQILHSEAAQTVVHPASLTKMMTLYVLFNEIKSKRVSMHTMLPVSTRATKVIPLKLWLKAGEKINVSDAIMGIIVHSANDASVAVAEGIAGTEEAFAHKMNLFAKKLGMSNTRFYNSSGLPDHRQVTTAADMAKLGLALRRDHPEFYSLFKKTSFVFKGKVINSHNKITKNYPGAEGLKTGYTNASGCNLVTTASREGKSLVAVVIGGNSAKSRDNKMMKLLDKHFGVASVDYDATSSVKIASSKKSKYKKNKKAKSIKLAHSKNNSKKHHAQKRV
jgi:D-alanyl-D-alanine carboxypeptidase (penicillin-binding protein 5/6)